MPPKKRKKKSKLPEGTPIEKYEYFQKEIEPLREHAVKVAEELNKIRGERTALEKDRDNMVHYYSSGVLQLMKAERERRRAERSLLHAEGLSGDRVQPVNIHPLLNLAKERESFVGLALDRYRDVFKAEEEIRRDRLRTRKEVWTRTAESEVALLKVRGRVVAKEVGRIGDAYIAGLEAADAQVTLREERLFDKLDSEADKDFKTLIFAKNNQVEEMRREHIRQVKEVQQTYAELKTSDVTIRLREEAVRLTEETSQLGNILAEYTEYERSVRGVRASAEEQATRLKEIEARRGALEAQVELVKSKYKELEESSRQLRLETEVLEDCKEREEEILVRLKKDATGEVGRSRLKQLRIHQAMEGLRKVLAKELEENEELLRRFKGTAESPLEELTKIHARNSAMKNSLLELSERALREYSLHSDSLDIPRRGGLKQVCRGIDGGRTAGGSLPQRPQYRLPLRKMVLREPIKDARSFGLHIKPPVVRRQSVGSTVHVSLLEK